MYPIPCFYIIISNNPLANSISLTSLGTCLKGGKAQLIWSVVPEGADLHDITFTPDKPTIVSVDPTGLVSFLEDGDFIITMSAKTGKGGEEKTLTAQINGHIDTLRIDVDPIGSRSINDRFWFVYKGDPSFDPGNPNPNMIGFNISPAEVMEEDDFYVTAVSETPDILSLAPSGIITCVSKGVGHCGMKGTYKDVTVTTLTDVYVDIAPALINPTAVANSYGDVKIAWDVQFPSSDDIYTVEVYDSEGMEVVWSKKTKDTFVFFDVTESVPIFGFAPTYLTVHIKGSNPETQPIAFNNNVTVDDSFVKEALVFAGGDNAAAHFNYFSGRDKTSQSATVARNKYASHKGFYPAEVLPINATFIASCAEAQANSSTGTPTNYWYDVSSSTAGPCLTQFLAKVKPYKDKIKAVFWSLGEQDAMVAAAKQEGKHSDDARFQTAMTAIFENIRSVIADPEVKIVLQTLGRCFDDSVEVGGVEWYRYRNIQQQLVVNSSGGVIIGSWVDGAESYGNYVSSAESFLRIHYRPTIYKNAAISLANMEDLSSTPPTWVDMKVPSGGTAVGQANQDILLSWVSSGYNKFFLVNFDVLTGNVISQQKLTTNSYTFTHADQVKQYGYAAGTVLFGVAYVQTTSKGDITSPLAKFSILVSM